MIDPHRLRDDQIIRANRFSDRLSVAVIIMALIFIFLPVALKLLRGAL
jgi:hypothetical protein